MGKRIRAKHKKRVRDNITAVKKGELPKQVKSSVKVSKARKKKNAYRWG